MPDEVVQGSAETVNQNSNWYQGAESLKTSDPDSWSHFENGVKSGAHKDLPTLIKNHVNLEKRLGTALVPPSKDAPPEEIAKFREKLYATGHVTAPPAFPDSPDKYELNMDAIPESMRLPELIGEFKSLVHKGGITPEFANELLALNAKQFTAINQLYEGSRAESESRIAELAKADNRTMNEVMEGGKRAAEYLLRNSPKTLEKLNSFLGNDPDIMYALSKFDVGEHTAQLGEGNNAASDVPEYVEARRIMTDPTHPDHTRYLNDDPGVHERVKAGFVKKFGTKEVT